LKPEKPKNPAEAAAQDMMPSSPHMPTAPGSPMAPSNLLGGFSPQQMGQLPKMSSVKRADGEEGAETPAQEAAEELAPNQATSLINFIQQHGQNIDDSMFHQHAESIGVNPHEAEEEVYRTLASLLGGKNDLIQGGKAQGLPNSAFPPGELAAAVKVEKEHTPSTALATEIGKDHAVETTKYYKGKNRLEDMEKDIETKKEEGKEHGAAPDQQKKKAYKYGFFLKFAELGMLPEQLEKQAFIGPLLAWL
jgi:hypothetical protein